MKRIKLELGIKKWVIIAAVLVTVVAIVISQISVNPFDYVMSGGESTGKSRNNSEVCEYAKENDIALWKYPDSMVELLERNSETLGFVLEYPINKDKDFPIDLSEFKDAENVPLFLQWDKRWGYKSYGSGIIATSGCGPTCLSMVAVYLLNDTALDPLYMSKFSKENGYCVWGNGTSWTLISEGAGKLGLNAEEIPLDENAIINRLKEGKPIICVMGPGDFTTTGHYIVLTEYTDGGFKVNDPNSVKNSNKIWYYEDIKSQFRNLWAISR